MSGGLAVRGNLLCVTWSAARGHVFLFDVEARQRMSTWTLPAGANGFSDAAGVAMDEHFHLYVADPVNDRVAHFSAFGRHLRDLGQPAPAVGDAARDRPGVLDRPHAVACRGDVLYVACGERPRRRGVQCFARSGEALRPLAAGGLAEQAFGAPRGLLAEPDGLQVADTLHGRIQRFRGDGTFVCNLPCPGGEGRARPVALVRVRGGALLVVDRGDEPGVQALVADGAQPVDLEPLRGACRDVLALAVDAKDRLYVLDLGGERVQRFARDLRPDGFVVDLTEHLPDYEPAPPT